MSFEYPQSSLGQVAKVRSGFAFKSKDWQSAGIPVVKIANVKNGRLDMSGCSFVSEEVAQAAKGFILERGDILISMTGYVGDVARVRLDDLPCALNQRVGRFHSFKRDKIHPEFLFFHLRDGQTRREIEQRAYGSAQPNISAGGIEETKIYLPDLQTQKAIARILGALDDKIELNQKMNQTLEDIAKAIFKSWFVDFDPVCAKAEGRPIGLPAEISDLFPDAFEDSEIGEIPAGWALQPLYDLGTFINGAAYKAFEPNNRRAGLPIIKIAELKSGITEQTGFSEVEMDKKYLVRERDILFSWSGNPDTSIDTFVWQRDSAWLNQHIFKVVPRSAEFRPFILQILRHKKPTFTEIARNKQTTGLGHVTVKDLKEMKIAVPPEQVLAVSGALLSALQERIFLAMKENILLAELRDTLLPKLISGELCIPDAEKFLEEAGI